MLTWRRTTISSCDYSNCVTYLQAIQTRQLSEFPILLFSGCILSSWICFAFNLADFTDNLTKVQHVSLFFSGPSKLTVVISWQFPIAQHKTGINSEHPQHVFTNLTAKWYFCLLLVPVVVGRNQSGFWQQIWKEKSKVIQLMHNWGKCRWMQSKGDMQGDLWKGCKRTQWHKSMAGHPGFQDSQPLDVRRPSDGHRPTETGAKGGTPKFIY